MSNFNDFVFKYGDANKDVKYLQRALRETVDDKLVVDGHFGDKTEDALVKWQKKFGATPGSGYSAETREVLNQFINSRYLQDYHYAQAAKEVGREVKIFTALTKSIAGAESRSEGFTESGDLKLLFERHKFRTYLLDRLTRNKSEIDMVEGFYQMSFQSTKPIDIVAHVSRHNPDICNSLYGGYKTGKAEQKRIELAATINVHAAYDSASFGLYQIMGFNAVHCGYMSGLDMYTDFLKGEHRHLAAVGHFLEANEQAYVYVKNRQYERLAKLYNGPAYERNNYHVKIKAELAKYGY